MMMLRTDFKDLTAKNKGIYVDTVGVLKIHKGNLMAVRRTTGYLEDSALPDTLED